MGACRCEEVWQLRRRGCCGGAVNSFANAQGGVQDMCKFDELTLEAGNGGIEGGRAGMNWPQWRCIEHAK
jgi:hypothetical protein